MTAVQPGTAPGTFRHDLRQATAASHARLDGAMSRLDLRDAGDRRVFGAIQYRGFLALGHACGWQAAEATGVLEATVRVLGGRRAVSPSVAPMDPDAVAYVALGSQLGLTVLRKSVPAEGHTGLFALEPDIAGWKAFTRRLSLCPPPPARAAAILADARRAFDVFLQEAETHLHPIRQATE